MLCCIVTVDFVMEDNIYSTADCRVYLRNVGILLHGYSSQQQCSSVGVAIENQFVLGIFTIIVRARVSAGWLQIR